MQELVAGVEKIRFDLEADVEQQRGAQPLPLPGMEKLGAAICTFFHQGPPVCKLWLHGPCTKGDGCSFLHECHQSRMPECRFCSTIGECSSNACPFLHVDTSTVCCPWYDRGFCRKGPLCKYKHMRRVMCANYLVGFCPEGPNCRFMHLKAGLMMSGTDPSKGAGCPWGLVQLDQAASKEIGCKDVLPTEPPLPVTGATQRSAAQPWDTNSCSLGTQTLPEQGTGLQCRQKGHCSSNCGKTQLEILLWR